MDGCGRLRYVLYFFVSFSFIIVRIKIKSSSETFLKDDGYEISTSTFQNNIRKFLITAIRRESRRGPASLLNIY